MSTASVSCFLSVLGQDVFARTPGLLSGWRGSDSLMFSLPSCWLFQQEVSTSSTGLLPPKQDSRAWAQNEEAFWLLPPPLSLREGHSPIIVKHVSP